MEIDEFTVAFPWWKRWQFVHIVSNPSGLFCQPSARLYPHAPPPCFLQVLILKGRKSIRLPLARASRGGGYQGNAGRHNPGRRGRLAKREGDC